MRKVKCPRCSSEDTKLLGNVESFRDLERLGIPDIWYNWLGLDESSFYPHRIYQCNSCLLKWDRTTELTWRKGKTEEELKTFWEEHKSNFWNSWYASRREKLYNLKCPSCGTFDVEPLFPKSQKEKEEQLGKLWFKCNKCGKSFEPDLGE